MARKRRQRSPAVSDGGQGPLTPRFRQELAVGLAVAAVLGASFGVYVWLHDGLDPNKGPLRTLATGVGIIAVGAAWFLLEGAIDLPFWVTPGDAPEPRRHRIAQRLITLGVVVGLAGALIAIAARIM